MNGLTLEEKALLTAGRDMMSTHALPDLGIGAIRMADGPMGVASERVDERDIAYLTPCPTALGASWDVGLVKRVGALVGADARRLGVSVMLAPNLNLIRSPLAGRSFELFSEDPRLTGALGVAWLEGLRSRQVGAAVKHLVCNDSETNRDTMNVVVDDRALREVYLLPFEMAAKAGCAALLTAYNRVNGEYCCEHRGLITTIVKEEWGFGGLIVSDWFGTHDTVRSALAGLDLEMPGPARIFGMKFAAAVEQGQVPAERLDDAAGRVAAVAKLHPSTASDLTDQKADLDLLAEAAAAGFVLLKNADNLLPLAPDKIRRLAVIGPNAASPCFQGGTFAKIGLAPDLRTPLEAIRQAFGEHCQIVYEEGARPGYRLPPMSVTPTRALGDGARGATVEYFGSHDFTKAPLAAETRDTNSLTWFGAMPGIGSIATAAGVRASGQFTPPADGRYRLFAGGTGDVRMLVDGREVHHRQQEIAPGDIMGVLKGGDADRVELELTGGETARIDIELRYRSARVQGLWFGLEQVAETGQTVDRAVSAARESDAVILLVGETSDAGVESKDRGATTLPAAQIELIDRVCEANPNVVAVANVAHAFDARWTERVRAFILAWYPGQEFGPALADVLIGKREPGGRLPLTFGASDADYPILGLRPGAANDLAYSESWKIGYRSFVDRGIAPRFELGAGLGYAAFEMSGLEIRQESDAVLVTLTVRNLSGRPGKEVVQLYLRAADAPRIPLLAGFASVHLAPGEDRQLVIEIPRRAFEMWDEGGWTLPDQDRLVEVGRSIRDIKLSAVVTAETVQSLKPARREA